MHGADPIDTGPTERDLTDWNEHNAHADDAPPQDEDDHDGPWAVLVIKPEPAEGEQALIRFGPLARQTADDWAHRLLMQLHSSAPANTRVTVSPYVAHAAYTDPLTIPTTVDDLVPQLRLDPGHPENGGFPDLFARLVMAHGHGKGTHLYEQALQVISGEEAVNEAADDIDRTAAEIRDLINEAVTPLGQAHNFAKGMLATAETYELPTPAGDYPEDLVHHLFTALRELRAAARVLGEG